jgi:bifunctional non-homologous end joining protein LigD
VKPDMVCEVVFTEWTGEGKIRHPSFQGIRADKKPKQVVREQA